MAIALQLRKLGLFLLWFSLFTVVVVIVTSNGEYGYAQPPVDVLAAQEAPGCPGERMGFEELDCLNILRVEHGHLHCLAALIKRNHIMRGCYRLRDKVKKILSYLNALQVYEGNLKMHGNNSTK